MPLISVSCHPKVTEERGGEGERGRGGEGEREGERGGGEGEREGGERKG